MKPGELQEEYYVGIDTEIPPYLPYPRFLLKMDMSQTAKLLYALLLDRTTLSQKNGWQDGQGRVYIVYPVAELAEVLDKGHTSVKSALNELEAAGLLTRKRAGFSKANHLYVKFPPYGQFPDPMTAGKPTPINAENRPADGQKTDLMTAGKPPPNKTNINKLIESQTKGASREPPAPHGRYGNVFLSESEYRELQGEIPGLDSLIEQLSGYMKSEGKQYADHAATLRRWAANEYSNRAAPKQGIPDYTYKEGQSL